MIRIEDWKLLLIDEDDEVRQALSPFLEDDGYGVLNVADGESGIELCRKEPPQTIFGALTCLIVRLKPRAKETFLPIPCVFILTGCLGPVALHEAVLGYDDTVQRLETEMLLLNIARLHNNLPDHFTVTSAIAATGSALPATIALE